MIKLRYSPGSPFGRKAALAARILGLEKEVAFVGTEDDPDERLRKLNPLGKIPLLVLDDDTTIFDSPVILEYFDHLAGGGKILPRETKARFRALTLAALADGMLDACVAISYEGRWHTPEGVSQKWLAHQQGKIDAAVDKLEGEPPAGPVDVGQIALVCALEFLDKRNEGRWRAGHPKLVAWLENFARTVPAYAKQPQG
jgi:glutathione S-transferase